MAFHSKKNPRDEDSTPLQISFPLKKCLSEMPGFPGFPSPCPFDHMLSTLLWGSDVGRDP